MSLTSRWIAAALLVVAGQQSGVGTTRIAVVNVPVVSERYLRTTDLEAQFEQRRAKFNEQRDALRQKIERTKRSLQEEFKPGTDEFRERMKQLAMQEAELHWFREMEGQKIEQGLAGSLRSIYNDIQAVVAEVARERGIDLVLAADQLPKEPPATTTQARQQVVLQNVLFWHPRVELTDEVVTRLNMKYKAQKLMSP